MAADGYDLREAIPISALRIVLAEGSLARYPDGGGHWMVYLQYLLGLRALGHEAFFLELLWSTGDAGLDRQRITAFFDRLRGYDLDEQCAVLRFERGNPVQDFELAEVFGRSRADTKEISNSADLFWNSCNGVTQPLLGMFRHRVLIDLDPGHLQVSALAADLDFDQHHTFLSVGNKLQDPDCLVPTFGLKWHTFTPFVYLPMWTAAPDPGPKAPFSSITQWTWGRELCFEDRLISTSKRDAYLRYLELPRHCKRPLELAANILPTDDTGDRELLEGCGWKLVEPWRVAASPHDYQTYIARCRAEISCPKPIYRELSTGWFSDRSACFLASGRPVLAEDTGFPEHLPSGEGLLAFHDSAEAAAGVAEIDADYPRHMRAARQLAEEHLDSSRILPAMLLNAAVTNTPSGKRSRHNRNASHKHGRPGQSGSPASPFPDLEPLTAGLNSALQGLEPGGQVTVLARDPNLRSGRRSPSEIVTVRLKDNSRRRLYCKYGGHDWHSHGFWGVAYEVEVYRHVLVAVEATTAKFYGAYTAAAPNNIWLILEYLDDCEQLKNAPQPGAMIETVRWLARFHAATEELLSKGTIPFLKIHDVAYYRAWAKRTLEFAASQHCSFSWLPRLCRKWEELAETLLLPPTSIIHGDFYASNVLMRRALPVVIDWESAAAAVGEIDLAFHTEGWPEGIVKLCEAEYQKTRWPQNPPPEFSRRLQAARLYQRFRWLGDQPEWISTRGLQQLRALAVALGLI
jgi:hypothetical protein